MKLLNSNFVNFNNINNNCNNIVSIAFWTIFKDSFGTEWPLHFSYWKTLNTTSIKSLDISCLRKECVKNIQKWKQNQFRLFKAKSILREPNKAGVQLSWRKRKHGPKCANILVKGVTKQSLWAQMTTDTKERVTVLSSLVPADPIQGWISVLVQPEIWMKFWLLNSKFSRTSILL